MKAIGIVRDIDPLGRLVLPKSLRDKLKLPIGTPVEIFEDNESIVLKKYERGCIFCGSMDDLIQFKGKTVCSKCRKGV